MACAKRSPATAIRLPLATRAKGSSCCSMVVTGLPSPASLLLYCPNDLRNHCLSSSKSMSSPLLLLFCCWFGLGLGFVCSFFFEHILSCYPSPCCSQLLAALPCLTNLSSNLLFSFFLFMLPNKETNSSEESECDDLDPNTSMEVETIILVIIFVQEHVPVLKCLCWKGSWWVCIAHGHMYQLNMSHTKHQFCFCQAANWSSGCLCDSSSGGSWGTSSCWAGGLQSRPQSLLPTWDLAQWNDRACLSATSKCSSSLF